MMAVTKIAQCLMLLAVLYSALDASVGQSDAELTDGEGGIGSMSGMRVVDSRRENRRRNRINRRQNAAIRAADGGSFFFRPAESTNSGIGREEPRIVFPDISPMIGQPTSETIESVNGVAVDTPAMELPDDLNMERMNVSLDELKTMSAIETAEDFLRMFGLDVPDNSTSIVAAASTAPGGAGIFARSGFSRDTRKATNAVCTPEETTVELDLPRELNVMYFPRCVRLMRCGGCCQGPLLKCQPTATKPVTLEVIRVESTPSMTRSARPTSTRGSSSRRRQRREKSSQYYNIQEVDHVACSCQCRIQQHHCNPQLQTYMQNECLCKCNNKDEEEKCAGRTSTHYWDNKTCTCFCLKEETCGTGQYFDHGSCRCMPSPLLSARTSSRTSNSGISGRFGGSLPADGSNSGGSAPPIVFGDQ